jgi:uncharacterized protein (TIGR00299 family) protein
MQRRQLSLEFHLDLIGGLAGDMFIAALLDAMPQYEAQVLANIQALDSGSLTGCTLLEHTDGVLHGRRFSVHSPAETSPGVLVQPSASHSHTSWQALRARLAAAALPAAVRSHAVAIFQLLADAEGAVHGVSPDTVQFHEVGAWDSIADIVGAATLIDALDASHWSASAVPLGSGRIRTQHGIMPAPAPATARLLCGMATIDDGVGGERVTPTGAAILRYLVARSAAPERGRDTVRKLIASGVGFGTRLLDGISNHVRVLCFESPQPAVGSHRSLAVVEFEVDDQTGEELATGLERLRGEATVLDVVQSSVYGKKGRMMAKIQVLTQPAHLDAVIEACFRETTTIGLRHHSVGGVGLERHMESVQVQGHPVRVKVVNRPGGVTAKTESDDVQGHASHALRAALRTHAETAVLDQHHEQSRAR